MSKVIIPVILIAQVAHEVNRAYCLSIGDNSQPTWDEAPDWQKNSIVNGVTFHLENPDADPAASHANWLKEKEADGWKYGAEKNVEAKEHPCFMPYDQLPAEQRAKDFLFRQIVHSMAAVDTAVAANLEAASSDAPEEVASERLAPATDLPAELNALSEKVVHGGFSQRLKAMANEISSYQG
jgi:hypothetical protein